MSNETRKAERKAQLERYAADIEADLANNMADYGSHELADILDYLPANSPIAGAITAELDNRADTYYSDQYAGDGVFAANH